MMFTQKYYVHAENLVHKAQKKQKTIALAESCTGGLISALITEIPGASHVFSFAAITYADAIKSKILHVPESILEKFGAVSTHCVQHMIYGLKDILQANIYFAVSGIAGPDGGSKEKPVGTVCFACCSHQKTELVRKQFPTHHSRSKIRMLSLEHALFMLHQALDCDEA